MTIHRPDTAAFSFAPCGKLRFSGAATRGTDIAARCPYLFSWPRLAADGQPKGKDLWQTIDLPLTFDRVRVTLISVHHAFALKWPGKLA